jgi:hypothetical protein
MRGLISIKTPIKVCVRLDSKENAKNVSVESFSNRNPYVIVSFILGLLTGLNAILAGSGYYYAVWPAHGPVGILGIFLGIFGFLTILGSFLVLKRKVHIVGAVLILVFGLISSMQGAFDLTHVTILLLPLVSFVFAVYAAKWDRKS